ncbi:MULTISPECIES: enoyl-CoA hydratase-related protein [unclassified Aurantimonas]|uniref:enoyl-CoA hydratase-related protein n=1 Tax=unclassified Aurantimonas TaxID=2638230 RepID=UPI002E19FF8A|nr:MULTISPECIES: enoyl-CoA hydratase-related protein [unclassified Aurantimonas]MEC5293291.1 enoyl-CoA hydratase-related protein [Aurantimonas sp. C2-3-R2]MEC5414385.1 enoyl-CoA hydratase-related protein [Aurantimonas sp. C2-4-R8]
MDTLLLDRPRPGVLLVQLNRPAKRNALNIRMVAEIASALAAVEDDESVRCIVVTGDDKAFSAGADIADQHAQGTGAVFSRTRLASWENIQNFRKPIIAAVNGYALGGGCELMMLFDMTIAGDTAVFGQPEINLGIFPGDGATQRLARLIGRGYALRLILSGERIDAAEALRLGLVTQVVPSAQTVERALDLAELIASKSPTAVCLAKEAIVKGGEMALEAGLLLERKNLALAFGSPDQKEGMSAFMEKRQPSFRQKENDEVAHSAGDPRVRGIVDGH